MKHEVRDVDAPLVSIGVPIYNGARFLRNALDSLLAQSLVDFELIISDNDSSDETAAICEHYAARDARIRYYRQARNIGAPRNWNFVAEQARGRYFKWASANDECHPSMLEKCVAALEADPGAVLSQGITCLVDEESGAHETYTGDLALPQALGSDRLASLLNKLRLNNGQSGLIRSSALRRTGLDRPYEGGDLVLMAELAMQGRFIVLPEVLLYRRMGSASFSRGLQGEQVRQFYDPQARNSLFSARLRLHFDLMASIARARLPLGERLVSLALALKRVRWDLQLAWAAWRARGATAS